MSKKSPADPVIRGRFAPSPTGYMHLGNARTALLAWLQVRSQGGEMILRIEDIDQGRCRGFAYDALRQDLSWLGLDWDQEYLQSERLEYYQAALDQLETYPCWCSRKDIQAAASAPHELAGVYPGSCRLHPAEPPPERPAALRWKIPEQTILVEDQRLGQLQQYLPQTHGDQVLRRNDGCYAYHLAVVVDDGLMGVTHVVRGEDLWLMTPLQVALQQALGYPRPLYLHVPLMHDYQGERLAKRGGAPSLHELRQQGYKPQKVLADLAASLGWQTEKEITAEEMVGRIENGELRIENAKWEQYL